MTQTSTKKVVLVGHGWPDLAAENNPVICAAARLRDAGWDVQAAFLKQAPMFEGPADVVVPFFMSDGYFTQKVRDLAGDSLVTAPVGVSSQMDALVDSALREVEGTVILAGHGTPKHAASRDSVLRHVERLREAGYVVKAGFIDDDPGLDVALRQFSGAVTILPYFVAPGPHTLEDVPEMAQKARSELEDVLFLPAIGLVDDVDAIIVSLINESLDS